ncbi:hypothetical protein BD779DRAFT_1500092 [Infundibulicybe gibba]|nr:hypothetical protein BD779DRAFT_1500092 [Infundibulicybe gibba]
MGYESTLPLNSIVAIGATSLRVGRYSAAAVYVLLVYEFLICFDDEWLYIHKTRFSSMKMAYFTCRYFPLFAFPIYLWAWLGDHTPVTCHRIIHPLYGFMTVFPLAAQLVILIRTFAFTGRSNIILGVLSISFLTVAVAEIWLFGTRFVVVDELYLLLGNSGCFANDAHAQAGKPFEYLNAKPTGLVMLGAFFLDVMMMVMVVVHWIRIGSVRGRLGRLFLVHGLGAFLAISAMNLFTACLYLSDNRQWDGLGLPFVLTLPDIIACRLVLALRKTAVPTTTFELRNHSRLVREALRHLKTDETTNSDSNIGLNVIPSRIQSTSAV